MHRLWYDPSQATEKNLFSMAMIHPGLVVLEDCKTILRRDYSNMTDKVKLISGGGSGNEPAYAGFIGPGMLTGAIYGDISSAPSVHSILRVIEELGLDYLPGVLLIIQNYLGYRINFGLAKSRAENMGIFVKILIVGESVDSECYDKTLEKKGSAGILFIHKIAGAMAEDGKNLESIYNVCNRITNSGEIATVSISMKISLSHQENLSSGNCSFTNTNIAGYNIDSKSGVSEEHVESLENVAAVITNKLMYFSQSSDETTSTRMFSVGHDVALMVNNLGGSNPIECNVLTFEILKKLKKLDLTVRRIYTGHLMTTLDTCGFQVSLFNLSIDPHSVKYLDVPTLAPAWPKVLTAKMVGFDQASDLMTSVPTKYCKEYCGILPYTKPQGAMINDRNGQVFLIVISFACEALIACTKQLNIMDRDYGDGNCGTILAQGANAIKSAMNENKISSTHPFVTFTQISCIIEKSMNGLHGGLYSLFFNGIAKVFAETDEQIVPRTWLNALIEGNKIISEFGKISVGDRTMLDPLTAAQKMLSNALGGKMHPIQAFGEAVKAAEQCAMQTMNARPFCGQSDLMKSKKCMYPEPGAHAVTIWMRAAYEGVKLKFVCQCES